MPERQDGSNAVTRDVTETSDAEFGRRRILQLSAAAIAGGAVATGTAAASGHDGENDTGTDDTSEDGWHPLGGGEGYEGVVHPDAADVVVRTHDELGEALSGAAAGDVVYVAGDASIDLGESTFTVPSGVTLASDRGIDGRAGGHLHTDAETDGIYVEEDARVTGIRLQGPFYEYFDPDWYAKGSGLRALGDGVVVDNCEIWGYAYAAVYAAGDAHIHHNHIHHNARDGLGYGVLGAGGHPLIEWNYFDYNRHSVASTGGHHGYTVRYNHFAETSVDIVIDVHKPGCVNSEVHNNIVEAVEDVDGEHDPLQAIQVRGVPDETFDAHHNWFFNPVPPRDSPTGSWTNEAIIQVHVNEWTNVEFWDNHYGADADVSASDIIPGYGN